MNNYKDLLVWQKSIDYTIYVYSILKSFPKEEIYSLTSQIKRSLISIPMMSRSTSIPKNQMC